MLSLMRAFSKMDSMILLGWERCGLILIELEAGKDAHYVGHSADRVQGDQRHWEGMGILAQVNLDSLI